MRLLGIDAGEKRIGLAISDKLNKTASPLTVLDNDETLKENLSYIIKENNIGKIIIGMPYNLSGEEGYQVKRVKEFIENNLRKIIKEAKIEIVEIDERFTSKISKKLISESKIKSGRRSSGKNSKAGKSRPVNIDSISAAILLNDYIEREKELG